MTEQTMQLYREWAGNYDRHMRETNHYQTMERLLDIILTRIPGIAPNRCYEILDPACGTGNSEEYLSSRRPDLFFVANDISPDMLNIARQKLQGNKNIWFTNWDMRKISANLKHKFPNLPSEFPRGAFATILLSYTMY